MIFNRESDFENHLREIINSRIMPKCPNIIVLKYKTVGDIVIMRNGLSPAIFFIEVKYYQRSKGRLGLGDGSGGGIQPEILQKRPAYLESNLRWIIGSDAHSGAGYWFIGSDTLINFISGGSIGNKQNNIQEKLLKEFSSVNEDQLVEEITRWLSTIDRS